MSQFVKEKNLEKKQILSMLQYLPTADSSAIWLGLYFGLN